jgi:23S rRNA pseudouridine1911/1915/1917 synthase
VKKTYVALVEGLLREPSATIALPIERNPRRPQTFKVSPNGKPAETVYDTVEIFAHSTLLALRPLTGRTHQLRVHTAYIGHPIVGDAVYGHADARLSRPFLHAAKLELTLPSKQRQTFEAPLPADLRAYLDGVRADA